MTDFLISLANRTLGLAPLAEPLIAPMFALDPLASTVTAGEELLVAPPVLPPPALSGAPAISPPAIAPVLPPAREEHAAQPAKPPQTVPARAPTVVHATPVAALNVSMPAPLAPREHPALTTAPTAPATAAPTAPAAATPTARRHGLARPLPAAGPPLAGGPSAAEAVPLAGHDLSSTVGVQAEEVAAAVAHPAAPPGRSAQHAPDNAGDVPLLMPLDPAPAPPARGDLPAGVQRAEPIAIMAPIRTAATARHSAGNSAAADGLPAAPTIEITIGRVEVRAVQPPAPAPRPKTTSPHAPALSLEEYLRNQNGGRR